MRTLMIFIMLLILIAMGAQMDRLEKKLDECRGYAPPVKQQTTLLRLAQ